MNDPDKPIVVTDDTLLPQLASLGRYVLTAGGAYVLGKGWLDGDTLAFLSGLVTVAAPAIYGVYKTWSNKTKLIAVASAAPDSVAQVK